MNAGGGRGSSRGTDHDRRFGEVQRRAAGARDETRASGDRRADWEGDPRLTAPPLGSIVIVTVDAAAPRESICC